MASLTKAGFLEIAGGVSPGETLVVPLTLRLLGDQLTPVLAYRRLVAADERTAPSFLLESVEDQQRQGRHSILGAGPSLEVLAEEERVRVVAHRGEAPVGGGERTGDPLAVLREISGGLRLSVPRSSVDSGMMPDCALGGWFGYAGYDSVRYAEPGKLGFDRAPEDDRGLPDVAFGFYDEVVVFDHVEQTVYLIRLCLVGDGDDAGDVYERGVAALDALEAKIQRHSRPLPAGRVGAHPPARELPSNTTRARHAEMVERAREYIRAGDIFQVVLGQRFERESAADPFDVYRALRAVNPSPYMVYMQAGPCILIASSPEILCRVERTGGGGLRVTNRPLAGTRRRGRTEAEDLALEAELLADPKERSEHVMLVDLGRNDVGVVSRPGSIELERVMTVERYSHVMHISSTVTGELRGGVDAWDALRAALPVGTISGAPKIRAMQIIDELEPVRRGPYGGGMGYVGLDGQMDIALALRTMVAPVSMFDGGTWTYHIQAAGGIVMDSVVEAEYDETVNKAAALGRAIDVAEEAFGERAMNGDGRGDEP